MNEPNIWERRSNLAGIELTDVLLPTDVFHSYDYIDESGQANSQQGICADLLHVLGQKLNFTLNAIEPPDGQWGVELEDGKFNGIVGMMQNGSGDLSSAGLTILIERSQVMDYSMSFYQGIFTMVTKASDGKPAINYLVYVHIFSLLTWAIIFITIIAYAIAFASISKFDIEDLHDVTDHEEFGVLHGLALNLRMLGQLDYPIKKEALTTKILFLFTAFFSFILFCFYTADLTSLMTTGPAPSQIRTFQDAFDAGMTLIINRGTATQTILE